MRRNVWTTPFGMTLLIGSAFSLVAGYAYGRNVLSAEQPDYNSAWAVDNLSGTADENALIEANREPASDQRARPQEESAPAPPADTKADEVEVPAVTAPEPDPADQPGDSSLNESYQD